jgi:hypothetical protein
MLKQIAFAAALSLPFAASAQTPGNQPEVVTKSIGITASQLPIIYPGFVVVVVPRQARELGPNDIRVIRGSRTQIVTVPSR